MHGNEVCREERAINVLNELLMNTDFESVLSNLNGLFSLVCEYDDMVVFAADHLRSMPLFYSYENNMLIVGNVAQHIYDKLEKVTFNALSLEEFAKSIYVVSGENTIFKEIFQVQAGEIVKINKDTGILTKKKYYQYKYGDLYIDEKLMKEDFYSVYKRVGDSLIKALDGRVAVVSLSGGADSRMVLKLLNEANYKNVICYTFGRDGSADAKYAKELAYKLGYPWYFFPETNEMWKHVSQTDTFRELLVFSSNYASLPHYSDYIAVKHLLDSGIIDNNAVMVTGHCGDLFAGSTIANLYINSDVTHNTFNKHIRNTYYSGRKLSDSLKKKLVNIIELPQNPQLSDYMLADFRYCVTESHAKFCANSERVHDFLGLEWLLPLWDKNLISYWSKVPIEWKCKRKLYFECVGAKSTTNHKSSLRRKLTGLIRQIPVISFLALKVYSLKYIFGDFLASNGMFGVWKCLGRWLTTKNISPENSLINSKLIKMFNEKSDK